MQATPEDRAAILQAVGTFREGAPILADDVKLACAVDGHPVAHLPTKVIAHIMRQRCDPHDGPYGRKDYHSWIRRW